MRLLIIAVLFCAMTARGATVAEAVARAASTPPFDAALWFVLIEDENGSVVHERNATKLAIPASVRKLFTAATVAECLALDRSIETELWVNGDDVVIKGGGDPSFGSERYYHPEETALAPFVQRLRERGVVRVRDVIADVSRFDRVTIPFQWKVGNIVSSVAAPVDAIVWSENDIGSYAVASAGHFAALALRDALVAAGIEVTGEVRLQTEPASWENLVAVHRSPIVFELLATVLKPSHNLFAETLYKVSGATGEPASYDAARSRERAFLTKDVGIAESTFRFVDGSGLAPDDLVTPQAVVRMLRWMNDPLRREVYWKLLPVPGEQEGTLRSRLVPLADRLRAKTGTVAGVNSLAGIIRGRQGGHRYFAIMVNHHIGSSSAASRLIDAIVEAAAEF